MAYWLFKSEPNAWSWDDQVAKGDEGEEWDGVRNYQARNNMRAMKIGDRGFFYHSLKEKSVVGVVEVIEEARQDSSTDDTRWDCVVIKALHPVKTPVTLEICKTDAQLSEMVLVKSSRLSVQPITPAEWARVCELAGIPAH
ncbi:EVE domain-containing protein [Halocynthiibacter namhaensis]|uniref:EVE domain-containing protein n=1 Tax=Halocynthiibacter namhaensis TaxID=1290553 RepID=UPI00057980AC|nr:EVE domain-containing protein [Halocynthiibacter namhaensis]